MRRAGGGAIINISSTNGLAPVSHTAAYTASKFAVRGMTKVAALELGKDNIRVNSIHPGLIRTQMLDNAGEGLEAALKALPIPRCGLPSEVAKLMLFLASDDSSYSTGAEFVIDGGFMNIVGF